MNERKPVCFVKFPLTEIIFLLMENSLFESFVYSHILSQEAFALVANFLSQFLSYHTTIFTWLLCSITKIKFHRKMMNSRLHRNNKNKLSIFYHNSEIYDEFPKRLCGSFWTMNIFWYGNILRKIFIVFLFKAENFNQFKKFPFFSVSDSNFKVSSFFMNIKMLFMLELKWLSVWKIWIANYVLIVWIIKHGQLVKVGEH